jgi:glycyl-radical enzyme activating protein
VTSPGVSGLVLSIQKFCISDGPGIRTAVFLKGCPLTCAWCHNWEGISPEPELSFSSRLCTLCGQCVAICGRGAHSISDSSHQIDRLRCMICGKCARECPSNALEIIGKWVTVDDVLADVLADRPFYESSGGGMTVSGGEPTAQIEFVHELLRAAKEEGIHCCLETCGATSFENLERLIPFVDLFLYDYKETDPLRHVHYTGVSNDIILDNLSRLYARGARIRLRCPIIPGCNDRVDHLKGIASLARSMPNLDGIDLLPHHPLGGDKRERLGKPAGEFGQSAIDGADTAAEWLNDLRRQGIEASIP